LYDYKASWAISLAKSKHGIPEYQRWAHIP
jgi:hypothetical protein